MEYPRQPLIHRKGDDGHHGALEQVEGNHAEEDVALDVGDSGVDGLAGGDDGVVGHISAGVEGQQQEIVGQSAHNGDDRNAGHTGNQRAGAGVLDAVDQAGGEGKAAGDEKVGQLPRRRSGC